jgi:hypothetical protein
MDIFLILLFTVFIFFSAIHIIKKNVLFGILYTFLFIYSIFAQIGYCFFPELSELISAFFGKKYFYIFYTYNFLSFLLFYILFYFYFDRIANFKKYTIVHEKKVSLFLSFIIFIFFYYSYLLLYLIANFNDINYQNASDPIFLENSTIFYKIFAIFYKSLVGYGIIFYVQLRSKFVYNKISYFSVSALKFLNLLNILFLFVISTKIGSRTDILAFIIGIIIFESLNGLTKKTLIFLSFTFIFVTIFLLFLEQNRLGEVNSIKEVTLTEKIILKDYFAPAHLLFTAMNYNFIDPLLVLKSNFANSLILLNVDYLQMPITELIAPGVANRSQGFAFYLFTEGYLFMGFSGFIYNAFMLLCGLVIWYIIYNSNLKPYRIMILTIMCTQVANLARSQSSYFYKDILVIFIPIFLFIYLSSGLRPKFVKK